MRNIKSESQNLFLPETRYCYTLHTMDNHGDSVSVTKHCATLENCHFTGCTDVTDTGYQVRGDLRIQSPQPAIRRRFPASIFLSPVRCARPAARGTSATCWCRRTTAAPFSPPLLLWSAQVGGFTLRCWPTSSSSSSSLWAAAAQLVVFKREAHDVQSSFTSLCSVILGSMFPSSDAVFC